MDKSNKQTYLIDIDIRNTHNVKTKIQVTIRKYTDLIIVVLRFWKMEKVHIVPIILTSKTANKHWISQSFRVTY